jgi:hypothetical protein
LLTENKPRLKITNAGKIPAFVNFVFGLPGQTAKIMLCGTG